MIAGYVSFVLW